MALSHAILGILLESDADAQALTRELRARFPTGAVNSGQLHAALREGLQRALIITRSGSAGRGRPYAITDAGRQAFEGWLQAPLTAPTIQRDELLARVVFQGERDPEGLLAELRERRRELLRQMMELQPRLAHDEQGRWHALARDVVACRLDGELRAVERCLVTIEEIQQRRGGREAGRRRAGGRS